MTKVKFSVACNAIYYSELEVEDELSKEEILDEIHCRLNEAPIKELDWLSDLDPEDAVTMEDIISIEETC